MMSPRALSLSSRRTLDGKWIRITTDAVRIYRKKVAYREGDPIPRKCEGLLGDGFGGVKREIDALVVAKSFYNSREDVPKKPIVKILMQ
jgi:hypothetical protein